MEVESFSEAFLYKLVGVERDSVDVSLMFECGNWGWLVVAP